jgi:hypothetical protein
MTLVMHYPKVEDPDLGERFAVLARRSGASVFGAAAAICKDINGKEIHYQTMEEAEAEAARLNEWVKSANVRYSAVSLAGIWGAL